jgi:cell division inhibitor SulA/protein ImuA
MSLLLLDKLVRNGRVWRGDQAGTAAGSMLSSGIAGLDGLLGGGWPRGALTEILARRISGISLLVPALARLSEEGRWLAWVAPPRLPYAPALAARGVSSERLLLIQRTAADRDLWAAEQALRSGACGAVLIWPDRLQVAQIRRLQLAAEQGDCLGVLFRAAHVQAQASPAALRLSVAPEPGGLRVRVLKRRGGFGGAELRIRP